MLQEKLEKLKCHDFTGISFAKGAQSSPYHPAVVPLLCGTIML